MIVAQHNGVAVPLHDVGNVIDGPENTSWLAFSTASALSCRHFQATRRERCGHDRPGHSLPAASHWLPPSVKLDVMHDRTTTIRASVNDVEITLMIGIALVVMVMFLFSAAWPTIIAGITMPLSLAGTFGVMWFFGYSLDNLSLMALTVSTGFVVDDAIVVIENIVRFIEKGESPLEARSKARARSGSPSSR